MTTEITKFVDDITQLSGFVHYQKKEDIECSHLL